MTHGDESCASLLVIALQLLRGAELQHAGIGVNFLFRSLRLYLPRNPDSQGDTPLRTGSVHYPLDIPFVPSHTCFLVKYLKKWEGIVVTQKQ